MASHDDPHFLPAAIYTAGSVLISVIMGARLFLWKRRETGDSRATDATIAQQEQQELDGSRHIPSTSSSFDPEPGHEFEVFLSFRGSDNRKTFTDCLYHSLMDAGVRAFRDNEELGVGEEIGPKLMNSIGQSKIGMPIFSKDYASSKWCLKEVTEMVKCMKETKLLIMPVFLDVTPDEVQHQTGSYASSFARHEKRFDPEMVKGWRDALQEVVKLKGSELETVANGNQGEFIKYIVARIIRHLRKSYLDVSNILVGVEDRAEEFIENLEVGINDIRVVGVWGTGGIGKTTLAKFVYNQIADKFDSNSFLNNIRDTSRSPRGLEYLQSKLASDILRREREEYANVEEGINVLKERLRDKKALILLDDVDNINQLKALAGDVEWFGRGSRIIITTREKQVLSQFQVQDPYEVALLDNDQALELFCKHAFGDKLPRIDFVEHTRDVVSITGRLPLALEVIGSFLSVYGGRKDIWSSTIEKLKLKPNMDIQDKLKISFESLDFEQREIFLDIACFFIGMDVRLVTPMWHDSKFFPEMGIEILLMKSLIKIGEDNTIWMHDQLRDLGRYIVEQENFKEPGQRSRLWNSEEAASVLVGQQGTSKVEAINIDGRHSEEQENWVEGEMLRNMSRLRILELGRVRLERNFQHNFHQLRWLSWRRVYISLSPQQNLILKNLIVLDLSFSIIYEDWIGWSSIKIGMKLKVLNLGHCEISRTPEFSAFPSLESLILEACSNLVWVDPSIALLKNLLLLNLRNCRKLADLPEELGSMESLVEFLVDHTLVQQLPISRRMKKLEILSASNCKSLCEIPTSIGSLENLKRLSLQGCEQFYGLPESICKLTSLVELNLSWTKTSRLPDFVGKQHDLEVLKINHTCIQCLPRNLGSLKKLKVLDASNNFSMGEVEISDKVLGLSSLKILKLSRVKSLPSSRITLPSLQTLCLEICPSLQMLPELPSSLSSLEVVVSSQCHRGNWETWLNPERVTPKMPVSLNLANLVKLKELLLLGDFGLKEDSFSRLRKLEKLFLRGVKIPEQKRWPELGNLVSLKELRILFCPFNKLPDLSKLKNLLCLDLSANPKLADIQGLRGLGNCLKELVLCWNKQLTQVEAIAELESLRDLHIINCGLRKLPNLSKLQRLEGLSMRGCEGITEFPAWLWELTNLKWLDLMGSKALVAIFKELELTLERLKELHMCDSVDITDDAVVRELRNLERMGFSGFQELKMKDLGVTRAPGPSICHAPIIVTLNPLLRTSRELEINGKLITIYLEEGVRIP